MTTTTAIWVLGDAVGNSSVLLTAVQEGGETAITLTVTVRGGVSDVHTALAALRAEIQRAAAGRREAVRWTL